MTEIRSCEECTNELAIRLDMILGQVSYHKCKGRGYYEAQL